MKPAVAFLHHHEEPLYERQRWHLPVPFQRHLGEALEEWRREDKTQRLWQGDASLWAGRGEAKWPQREVFELHFVQGFEPDEVAMIIGQPLKTVLEHISAMQSRLHEEMAHEEAVT